MHERSLVGFRQVGGEQRWPGRRAKHWPRWKIAEEGNWAHGMFLACKRRDLDQAEKKRDQ